MPHEYICWILPQWLVDESDDDDDDDDDINDNDQRKIILEMYVSLTRRKKIMGGHIHVTHNMQIKITVILAI